MSRLEKTLRRHAPIPKSWVDMLSMPLRTWIQLFFIYCLAHHLSFYWEWRGFLIVAVYQKSTRSYRVHVHLDLSRPPYRKTLEYKFESPYLASLIPFLLHLYDRQPSDFLATRNRQASVRYLSFYSFLVRWNLSEKEFQALSMAQPVVISPCLFQKEYPELASSLAKGSRPSDPRTWTRSELLSA